MTVAVIGDVHGEAKKLEQLIVTTLQQYKNVSFYCVGDLIDRGPDSKEVIDLCIRYDIKSCIGNHDEWLIDLINGKPVETLFEYLNPIWGGHTTLRSYGIEVPDKTPAAKAIALFSLHLRLTPEHKKYLKSMKPFYLVDDLLISHCGITYNSSLKNVQNLQETLEIFAEANPYFFNFMFPDIREESFMKFEGITQVFGHTPRKVPVQGKSFIDVDTGCGTCEPWKLTAYIHPQKEFVQV